MWRDFVKFAAIFVIHIFAFAVSVSAQQETLHTFLMMGKPAGAQTLKITPEGVRQYNFEFNDRGRGPKLKTRIRLDADGFPISIETVGSNYLNAPVAENFSIADGLARWKNTAEQGEKRLSSKAFYISMDGAPEEFALLAQALLKSPTKRLPLLPAGEAGIERADELTLKDGDKSRRVVAYEITGLGFTPDTVWLDEDGAFFGFVSSWSSIIREGWEASVPVLLKTQDERVRLFVKLLKDKKIVVDPTLNIFEEMFTDRPGTIGAGFAPIANRLPPQILRGLLVGGLPVPEGKDERYRASAKALLQMIKMIYDAGVPIVAGTDSMAGFALHRELELYNEAGIPANEVLKLATIGAARVMKRDGELGSIAPGKLADLILVDGNPATRISDIRRVSLVVKDGNIFEPAALYKNIGVVP